MPPRNDSTEFWNRLLHGSRMTEITELTTKKGVEDSEIKVRMRCPPPSSSGSAKSRSHQYTSATYLKAAWALFLANNSSASASRGKFDVIFAHGVTTRSIAPSESTDHIVGPCLDIVPVRVIAPSATPDASSAFQEPSFTLSTANTCPAFHITPTGFQTLYAIAQIGSPVKIPMPKLVSTASAPWWRITASRKHRQQSNCKMEFRRKPL